MHTRTMSVKFDLVPRNPSMSYITMPRFANVRIFTLSYVPIIQHISPRRHFNSHILPIPSTRRHEFELCIYDTTRQKLPLDCITEGSLR